MNLYLLTQNETRSHDAYAACIVAARTLEDATKIHPSRWLKGTDWGDIHTWASCPENVNVEYIGKAAKGMLSGVILASFHAG